MGDEMLKDDSLKNASSTMAQIDASTAILLIRAGLMISAVVHGVAISLLVYLGLLLAELSERCTGIALPLLLLPIIFILLFGVRYFLNPLLHGLSQSVVDLPMPAWRWQVKLVMVGIPLFGFGTFFLVRAIASMIFG